MQNQKKLNRQITINHEQELLKIDYERKNEAIQSILLGEEQERKRLAQDLHDSLGGMLTATRMHLIATDSKQDEGLQKLDLSIAEMRRIARNLMPETLKNLGLERALKDLCASMASPSLNIQLEAYDLDNKIPFAIQPPSTVSFKKASITS